MFEVRNTTTGEMHTFNFGENGIDWVQDILGNYNAYEYNDETEEYEMTGESIEWWKDMFNQMKEVDSLFGNLEEIVDDYEEYQKIANEMKEEAGNNDLETEYAMLKNLLEEKIARLK